MRILLVSEDIPQPSMGGLAKHVLTLSRALRRAGHQVDILGNSLYPPQAAGDELDFGGRFFGELNGHFVGWKEKQLGMFMPPRRTWVARRFASTILRHAQDYDVIHYHGHYPNVARFIPPEINFVQTRHDQGSDCLIDIRFRNGGICRETAPESCAGCRSARPNAIQKMISRAAVVRFRSEVAEGFQRHKTVFVSNLLVRNLKRSLGDQDWGTVIHNFIDTESVRRAREAAAALQQRDPCFHIVVAGKLYPVKGIEAFLLEAAPRLRPDMRITVIGDGPDGERLRAQFESPQIRFAGWCTVQKTLETTASADVVVVPSLCEEAFGATTLEGLLLGKPTFALAHGATPELAVYASADDQLRLHPDMASLVRDLITFQPGTNYIEPPPGLGGPDRAVQQLLTIYRMPPGKRIFAQEMPCPSASP